MSDLSTTTTTTPNSNDNERVSSGAGAGISDSDVQVKVENSSGEVTTIGLPPDSPLTNSASASSTSQSQVRIHPDLLSRGVEYVKETILPLIVGSSKDSKSFPYVEVATELMVWIEKTQGFLHGFDKKRIVLRIMETVLEKQEELLGGSLTGHEEEVSTILKNVIPSTMDFIVAATKGKLELNHAKKAVKHCIPILGKLWACFSKKK
jgi:hypothetical protein